MRTRPVPPLALALIAGLAALAALAAIVATPAAATPSRTSTCTSCHTGAASGTVTAVPSTATPSPGATYTVAIDIGLTASGKTGYHVAQTDAAGSATTWMAVYSGTGSQTAWTATMTAPATPGAYYYKVWTAKGYSGMAKAVTYGITVPAPVATPAITSLTPAHAQPSATVVIAGSNLGASGAVRFGATTATTTAWSSTSVTATVPASLAPGATTVTVTPAGGSSSNALAFTVDAPPATAPVLTSLLPTTGIAGSTLVVTGSNLGASGSVTVGGVTAATSAWSATSITCTVPAGLTTGAKSVVVTPAGAAASNALTYTVTAVPAPAPALTSLNPTHAQTGATVVIAGSNLGASGAVRFGATTATTTAWSSTSVTATVPASLAPGATTVTVTPAGGSASNGLAFTVDAPPVPADTTDPVTSASGIPGVAWCNYPVTVALAATDETGGSGVQSISYAVDGGAPVVAEGAAASVLLETSGMHTVAFFAKDVAGNVEATQSVTVNLDLSKPRPQAPRSATARQKRTATLRYRIVDAAPNGGAATVTIVVKNSRGKTVKRLELGSRPVNKALKATFACGLRPGDYRFRVSATDAAGNPQAAVASQRLRVLAR